LVPKERWLERCACAGMDTEWFFDDASSAAAAAFCRAQCPVTGPCRRFADREGIRFGVWGGATAAERWTALSARRAEEGVIDLRRWLPVAAGLSNRAGVAAIAAAGGPDVSYKSLERARRDGPAGGSVPALV